VDDEAGHASRDNDTDVLMACWRQFDPNRKSALKCGLQKAAQQFYIFLFVRQ
jgi:hypothetical protein